MLGSFAEDGRAIGGLQSSKQSTCGGSQNMGGRSGPPNDPERAPYRGLKPLEAENAAVLFGREAAGKDPPRPANPNHFGW